MQLVEAVKTTAEVQQIAHKLTLNARGNTLYADLWNFGLQVALRISDLLTITYDDALQGRVVIKESKTGKVRSIKLNEKAAAIVQKRREANPTHRFLFEVNSNRAKDKPVSRIAVATAFKAVGDELGISLGTHSMRKTRGWLMHSSGVSIEKICKVLNHSSPAVTMAYIGLTQAEIDDTYDEFVI
ncbi:tyrosine-type recombinase/integrase (plasmid) [Pseudomonas monsensis]|uniref:tyrosine-type recombinase/integrase n=1 Tax=Pseudomonas monsensis TaxID=2745509 RepID=UPI001648A702|nr:tyrosine-type recombinase/integrase [Pseudomonas monsensis]QXI03279.1 tyrosine-type recombinase/integrase [Pseudomonas monsensis]